MELAPKGRLDTEVVVWTALPLEMVNVLDAVVFGRPGPRGGTIEGGGFTVVCEEAGDLTSFADPPPLPLAGESGPRSLNMSKSLDRSLSLGRGLWKAAPMVV
jgi:hypothetical protein